MSRGTKPRSGKVLPVRAMKAMDRKLLPTIQIDRVVLSYTPHWLAMALGPESGIPNAWTALLWASHALQAARYHLYLAEHERCLYHDYHRPPAALTGDALATWFFTSFSLHAIAAENHLATSMLLAAKLARPERWNFGTKDVIGALKRACPEHAVLLKRISGDADWHWIREFRERWFHRDPVRVAELGLQWRVDFDRSFFVVNAQSGTRTLPLGIGDGPEVGVSAMIERGRRGFNMLATQFALYVTDLDEGIRRDWQRWDPFARACRLKKPRREPIRFLRAAASLDSEDEQ